jgi:hypothetical protein
MKQFRVTIPKEHYSIIEFIQEDLTGVGVVNSALKNFEPKEVFGWHLSVVIDLEDLIDNGMPSIKERHVIDPFGEELDKLLKGENPEKPNPLFLARITWNKTRELIWRVYDPEIANAIVQDITAKNNSPRALDYRIDPDNEWQLAQWHLSSC